MRKFQPLVALLVPVVLIAGAAYADREVIVRDGRCMVPVGAP